MRIGGIFFSFSNKRPVCLVRPQEYLPNLHVLTLGQPLLGLRSEVPTKASYESWEAQLTHFDSLTFTARILLS